MALRVLLVSLVASMGFELPSGQDVQSWADRGGRWVHSRVDDLASLRAEAERAFVGEPESERVAETSPSTPAEVASIRDDLSFDAVVEGMTSNFAADLASKEETKPVAEIASNEAVSPPVEVASKEEARPVAEVASPEPTRPVEPSVAAVEPSKEVAEPICLDPNAEAREGDVIVADRPETSPIPTAEAPSTADKLSSAVRLTKQAMDAWASLARPSADRPADRQQDDAF